jgi:hypothetical protein
MLVYGMNISLRAYMLEACSLQAQQISREECDRVSVSDAAKPGISGVMG